MPKPGTLLKLTMTNFQTFKHATFTFSPHLNFIAAPNGSGKSTITNAINFLCLGTPTTLSKNMALKDFIKFGQTTATIEGFFYGEAKRKPSIRDFTSFNSQNKNIENMTSIKRVFTLNESHFYIDGEKAKKIDVSNLLNSWNINVMNMTQFLPQDRVSEFAKMNSEELFKQVLKSTNISICENEIIELENIIKEKNKDLEAFNNKRKGTNSIVNNLKEDVDRTREAMQKQMKMKLIKFKILSIEYGNLLKDCRHINNEKKIKIMQIDENKKLIQMIEEEIKKINRDGDLKIYKEFEQKSRELEKFENVLDGLIKEKEIYKIDLLGLEKRKEKRKKEIVLLEEKKEEMRKKLNEIKKVDFHEVEKKSNLLIWNYLKPKNKDNNYYEADEMIKKQRKSDEFCINKNYEDLIKAELIKLCEKNKINFEKFSDKCSTEIFYKILLENKLHEKSIFKHDERNKKEEAANFRKQYENLEHQRINITEIEKKRLESLKKVSRDAYQAVIWLRENKNMFQSEILEPSYLHIKIKNESYIEEVESLLPRNALTTFICTSSDDFDLFTKLLKDEKRLKINALLHENNYQKKNFVDQNLRNRIQSHGFDYLCIDLLEGRDEYLDLFCSIGHIHTIPISKKYLNDEDLFRNFDYRKFIIKGRYIEKRVSRYNKSDYTIINSDCKRKYVFENKNYDKDLKIIENGLKEINCKRELKNEEMKTLLCKLEELEQFINKIYNMKAEFDTKNNEINEYENIKEKLKKNISYYENLLKKYLEDEDTREEEMIIKKNIKTVDEALENKFLEYNHLFDNETFYKTFVKMFKMHSDTQNVEREYERLIQAKIQPTMFINIAQEELRQIERHLEDVKSRRNVAKRTLQDEKRKIENFENENLKIYDTMIAESQKNILKNSVSIINDFSNDEDLSFENNENFDTNNLIARSEKYILGSYIEELKKLPEDIQNLRQEYSNEKLALTTYDCDLKAIELYKIKSKSLNEMDKEIGLLNKGIASNENKLKKIKNEVIEKIKNLLLPVNKRFSYFFEKMNCEGKIDFVYEDLDYHKWKIIILVRFREQEGLMQLSSGRQSGGEKSVSTILFLLALQNLSVSPFKLVDEINQGMDRNNERMISNLLIKISEEEDSPQFFIITPKIVSGIEFGERMKIIIIYGCENGMQQKFANYNSSLMI